MNTDPFHRPLPSFVFTFLSGLLIPCIVQGAFLGPPPEWEGSFPEIPIASEKITGSVNTKDRAAVVAFYQNEYLLSVNVPANWTGDTYGCVPGTTSREYTDATLRRINYFRAMTGLPAAITDNSAQNTKCQDAALMMIAEGNLSHNPPSTWACYTSAGAEAAGKSNIAIGVAGPESIDLYIDDPGDFNYPIGHRRWIFFPPLTSVGTGSTTAQNGWFHGSNALWVIGNTGSRPGSPEFVAWPPEGYVPWQLVYDRWSFSYNIDRSKITFKDAVITMSLNGQPVTLTREALSENNYGDDTMVWVPSGLPSGPPAQDMTYTVNLTNVTINSQSRNFNYNVTLIDPYSAPTSPTQTQTPTLPPVFTPTRTATPSVTRTQTPAYTSTMTPAPTPPLEGDLNGDGRVNAVDLFLFSESWHYSQDEAGYDVQCDRNADGQITQTDLALYFTLWP